MIDFICIFFQKHVNYYFDILISIGFCSGNRKLNYYHRLCYMISSCCYKAIKINYLLSAFKWYENQISIGKLNNWLILQFPIFEWVKRTFDFEINLCHATKPDKLKHVKLLCILHSLFQHFKWLVLLAL